MDSAPPSAAAAASPAPTGSGEPAFRPSIQLLLILAGGFLLLAPQPAAGYLRGDGLFYAAVMKEAARTGEWLTLQFAGEPYFRKPPLLFAAGAAVFDAFGASTLTARLLGVVPSLAMLAAVWLLGRRIMDGTRAFLAAAITATTYVFLRNGGVPRMDTAVTFLLTASVLILLAGERRPRLLLLWWPVVAVGVLLKGPSGLLPVAVVGGWSILRRSGYPWKSGWFWAGLPALPLFVAPWVLANLERHGDLFLRGYLVDDLARSVTSSDRQPNPFAKYGQDFIREWWPWLPFVAHGVWVAGRRVFKGGEREGPWALLFGWFAAVALSVLVVRTAYSRYLIPLLPATSLLAAHSLVTLLPRVPWRRAPAAAGWLAAAGLVFVLAWPGSLRSDEVPDVVRYAPALRAGGAMDPPLYYGENIPRSEQAAAIFYLDRTLRDVDEAEAARRVIHGGSLTVVAFPGRQKWPPGVAAEVLERGANLDLVRLTAR